jgi:hypothetical protein
MGILDDAIKEHLELKRQHGAGESELKQLEDEAFGAAERPGEAPADPLAEAPTEFMSQPEVEVEQEKPRSRRPDVADLQEPPPPPPAESGAGDEAPEPEAPVEEESPAMEHDAVPEQAFEQEDPIEPEISAGPTTEEREAIADQPTEMFDVEAELESPRTEAPSEEELVEEQAEEPRLAQVEDEYEEDDDFWDEKRLSDELDQALEAPAEEDEDEPAVFDAEAATEPEPAQDDPQQGEQGSGEEEDVLEETPDFLEEAPEDDQLWFEQKPPKDFDFDD